MNKAASYPAGHVPRRETSPDELSSLAVFSDVCYLTTVIASAAAFVVCLDHGGAHVPYVAVGSALAVMMLAICLSIGIEGMLLFGRSVRFVPAIRRLEALLASVSAAVACYSLGVETYVHLRELF